MINLNQLNEKKLLSKDILLSYINDFDVYKFYSNIPDLSLNKIYSSPLRVDNKPSFGLFIGESGEICFKDFNVASGDFIRFVQLKFGLNFYEALSQIAIDFNIDDDYIIKNPNINFKNPNFKNLLKTRELLLLELNTYKLGKKSRNWKLEDLVFWNKFGITKKTLELYKVSPVSHLFIGDKIITCKHLTYCFSEFKDNSETYKIYQPFIEEYKWLNNHNASVWQGWTQLPEKGEVLIITKSLKDVMSISDVCNIPAVSLQSESLIPKEKIINELKSRFKRIYVLYDNDYDKEENWGRKFASILCNKFNLLSIEIDEFYKSKDFSDLTKNHGRDQSKKYLLSLIQAPF